MQIQGDRLIILSDVHANLHALKAVLADIRSRGEHKLPVLVNGDMINLGPSPAECVELLRGLPDVCFNRGNHERYVYMRLHDAPDPDVIRKSRYRPPGLFDHIRWTSEQLSTDTLTWFEGLPDSRQIILGGVPAMISHATPGDDETTFFPSHSAPDIARALEYPDVHIFGHIHAPYVKRWNGRLFANAGSVGSPLDRDHRASYAVLTLGAGSHGFEIRRVAYNLEATIRDLQGVPWNDRIVEILRAAHI